MKKEKIQEKLNVGARLKGIPLRRDTTVPLKLQKGITLIALVITIIILLILAGVTLSIVFNGGIINKSQQAVDTYSEESAKEKLSLALFDYKMGYITGGEKDLKVYLESNGVGAVSEETTEYTVEVDGYEFIVKKENLEIISNGKANAPKPNISIEKVVSDDKKSATIKVTATATNGGTLRVKIGGQEAALEDGTYNLTVIKNGTYTVIVEESGLTRKAIGSVSVTEIEKTEIIANGNNINGNTNGTLTGLAYKYNNPVIPVGFKILDTTDAKWEDANNDGIVDGWNNGLVITDAESDGNEFVWVPVHNQAVIENGITIPAVPYEKWTSSKNGEPTASNTSYDTLPSGVTSEDTQITKYEGFYIARYEAGIPSNLTTALTTASKAARNVSGIPVSKKEQIPWNHINSTTSKANAERMYSSTYVKSGLVTGTMWDATMKWIENSGINVQTDSREWANYQNAPVTEITEYSTDNGASWTTINSTTKGTNTSWLLKTGHTDYIKKKNIYDLAGNVWEWTAEIYSSDRVYRGGGYASDGSSVSVAVRGCWSAGLTSGDTGFRCVLYVM